MSVAQVNPDTTLIVAATFWVVGIFLCVAWMILRSRTMRPGAPHCCPGPKRSWSMRMLAAVRAIPQSQCNYDLTGLPAYFENTAQCPECGRVSVLSPRIRRTTRDRALVCTGAGMFSMGVFWWIGVEGFTGRWASWAPTPALMLYKAHLADNWDGPVGTQVMQRASNGTITGWSARRFATELVKDLRDDQMSGNGHHAMSLLRGLGQAAVPALDEALMSNDWQQQQLAASLLREINPPDPSDVLIQHSLDALKGDPLTGYDLDHPDAVLVAIDVTDNIVSAVPFLVSHAERVYRQLVKMAQHGEQSERFLAALVLAAARCESAADVFFPVLIEHLEDNTIYFDAELVVVAMIQFGPIAKPYLHEVLNSNRYDRQAKHHAEYILLQYEGYPETQEEYRRRCRLVGYDTVQLVQREKSFAEVFTWQRCNALLASEQKRNH